MNLSIKCHNCIEEFNILKYPSVKIANFLDRHHTTYKIVLIISHLFRAAMVTGSMFIPYIPYSVKMVTCFTGSLFYRLTIERNCAYKFALPAFFGAVAFMLALPSIIHMINNSAFHSIGCGVKTICSLLPLSFYGIYILLTVNYDINKNYSL